MAPSIMLCNNCGHSMDAQVPCSPIDVNRYLRCGGQISEAEADLCSNTIVRWQEQVFDYDAENFRIKFALGKLEGVRQSLVDCIQTSEGLLAPVRRIPRDVLQDIFEYVCISVSYSPFPGRDEVSLIFATPFYLSSVCFYWRTICLSSPQLWTSVFANPGHNTITSHFEPISSLCAKRSGKPPSNLQVAVADVPSRDNQRRSDYNTFDALFYPYNVTIDPRRLKHIVIYFKHGTFSNALQTHQPLELPELECLELSGYYSSSLSYPQDERLIKLFERTPKLHTLRLSLQRLAKTPFSLPRDQIVNIDLANYNEYPSLTDEFPNAVTATLRKCQIIFYDTVDMPFRKLILHDSDMNPPSSMFGLYANPPRRVNMRRLTSLELICSEPSDTLRYTLSLQNIPSLAKSPLTELILTTVTLDCTETLSLLYTVPQLRRLSIVERIDMELITPEFIRVLGSAEILQELEHLQLVWSGDVDEGAIMDLLEGRALILRSAVIGVRQGGELRVETLSRVRALRKHGMQILLW
ncbi:uncharacterized protein EV420DRAFT_1089204 [Desarmillaria tabescens]|uniref:F-box domain-containing protein n=1 Tax=Armillaria tabescens TaxID=1929756 RepID=A0AA39ND54_ARMTA|nr:uncharacterized protein EV420DRAFT_1089204 [Desarmillaria tabescens]KAK0463447.1 hypothetical protein EV420DRAFT_1089204 [Desarmillaria tabescens]